MCEWRECLRFVVPGVPVGQPRVKATTFGGRTRVYTPSTITNQATGERKEHPIVAFKSIVKLAARAAYSGGLLDGPLKVDVECFFRRPPHMTWKKKPMPRSPHTSKPDRDNVDKAVLDCLKNIVLVDDCQVCDGRIRKWICAGDEAPRTEIVVSVLS